MTNFKEWLIENELAVKRDFNRQSIISYHGDLYHGTTIRGAICIALNGFQLYDHHELCGRFFCTSINDNIFRFFGHCGFVFEAHLDRLLEINNFYYELLGHETGMGGFMDDEEEGAELIAKAKRFGLVSRFGGKPGIDDQCSFFQKYIYTNRKLKDIQGICLPGWNNQYSENHEAEIAITQKGLDVLSRSLVNIVIEDKWYEPDEGWKILNSRAKEVDDEQCYAVLNGEK